MKTLHILCALLLCGGAACFETLDPSPDTLNPIPVVYPDAWSPDASLPNDVPGNGPTTLPGLPSSNGEFDWSIPSQALARDPDCPPSDNTLHGPSYLWKGFIHKGHTYTCNSCTGGVEAIQGEWRAVFDIDDPAAPYEKDPTYKEYLSFSGNSFINILSGMDLGQPTSATITGWMFCTTYPETGNHTKIFVLTGVQPEGAFGWRTGMVFSGDLLMDGSNALLWGWFDGVVTASGPGWAGTAPYCRIGTDVGDELPCENPFAPAAP